MSRGRLKIAAALVFASPFVPMLFQGEEWGASSPFLYFTDHQDPELARAVTQGRRLEFAAFGWKAEDVPDPQEYDTFRRSKLNWQERDSESHAELLAWHKRLIQLRRELSALSDGRLEHVRVSFDDAKRWLVVERGPVVIACNLSADKQNVPLGLGHDYQMLLVSERDIQIDDDAIVLPSDSVAILNATKTRQ